ncbi:MAG: oligoendopeptidase F, partial [Candidatus Marinimicrobia bacterium]|nr:oligoendopeptidase F [Candidatus Neomarinimicrobiota bacterium]
MLANGTALAQGSGKVPTRDEIAVTDQWELTSLFATDEAWETSFNEAQQLIGQFARFEGQLGKSGAKLLECLQFQEKVGIQVRLLYSYAAKKKDQDLGNTDNQARAQRITS